MHKSTSDHMENLRYELYQLFEADGNFQSKNLLKKSQELDKLIIEQQKQKLKKNSDI